MIPLKFSSLSLVIALSWFTSLTLSSCYREKDDRVETPPSQQQSEHDTQYKKNSLFDQESIIDTVKKSAQNLGAIFDEKSSKLEQSAKQEVSKLFTLEYKVVFIKGSELQENSNLQDTLTQLGADSWDCYNLLDTQEGTRLTCRRPSQSYLRWILKRNPVGF